MSLGIFSFDLQAFLDSLDYYLEPAGEPSPTEDVVAIDESAPVVSAESAETFDEEAIRRALESSVTPIIALPTDAKPPVKVSQPSDPAKAPTFPSRPAMSAETRVEFERRLRALQTQVVHNFRDADVADDAFGRRFVENSSRRQSFGDDDDADARRNDMRRDDERAERLRREQNHTANGLK